MSSLFERAALPLALLAWLVPTSAPARPAAAEATLTLGKVRALARQRAPQLVAARSAVAVAQAEVAGASRLTQQNPLLLVAAGPRMRDGESALDVSIRLTQTFAVSGQRAARIAGAKAGVAASRARAAEQTRRVVARASRLFVRALYAERAVTIARDDVRLTRELERVAKARQAAGEVGVLDVNVAMVTRARARSRVASLLANRARLLASLRGLLGSPGQVRPSGPLVREVRFSLAALRETARRRPDLRLLDSAVARAKAEQRLGRAQRWPKLGYFARYGREERANIFVGGLLVTLPFFSRGQQARARGSARLALAKKQRQAIELTLDAELGGRLRAYRKLRKALAGFEEQALKRLVQTLDLARKSYQAGNSTLANLIVLRREIVGAREAHLALKLRVALAAAALEAAAGEKR
jgi:cobalt-zinc-cadmium efflux system outer membrane protein